MLRQILPLGVLPLHLLLHCVRLGRFSCCCGACPASLECFNYSRPMVFREGRKWLEVKRENQSCNWAKLFKICVSLAEVCLVALQCLVPHEPVKERKWEPSLKAPVLKWVLGVVCRRALHPLSSIAPLWSHEGLCPDGMLTLEFQPRNTQNIPVNLAFYWEYSVQCVFVSSSTAAFTLFCRLFPSWSRGWHSLKTSWRNVLRISRKSFRATKTDFLRWDRRWKLWEVWGCLCS